MTSIADDSERLLAVATKAALSVGDPLRAAFRSAMGYSYKRDVHDIVTVHDRASEDRISAVIMGEVKDSTIIGEERGPVGNGAVHWYVDPIDGTSNFARGIANWCVSIAAAIDDRIVAGVIYDPVAGHVFTASLAGAWLNGDRLAGNASPEEARAVVVTGFPNARHVAHIGPGALDAYGELLDGFLAVRNLGSGAIQLAHVAAGWADATMGFDTNAWDIAAGVLIVTQAGGQYFGYRDGKSDEPLHLAPHYFAVGGNVRYPTLENMLERLSHGVMAPPAA
jgi:myo-inositol-1(or 4)-monophosphatase